MLVNNTKWWKRLRNHYPCYKAGKRKKKTKNKNQNKEYFDFWPQQNCMLSPLLHFLSCFNCWWSPSYHSFSSLLAHLSGPSPAGCRFSFFTLLLVICSVSGFELYSFSHQFWLFGSNFPTIRVFFAGKVSKIISLSAAKTWAQMFLIRNIYFCHLWKYVVMENNTP